MKLRKLLFFILLCNCTLSFSQKDGNSSNLEVNIQNSIAINFYKKYNFKEVGLRKKYYDNTYDAILMKLEF